MAKKGFGFWFTIVFSLYPFLMIGAYYIGWKTLFYVCLIPILILAIIVLVSNLKYGYWKQAVFSLLTWMFFSEIGYIITDNIKDGICLGCYISLICGTLQNMLSIYQKKRKQSSDTSDKVNQGTL